MKIRKYSQIYIIYLEVAKRLFTALSHVFRLPNETNAVVVERSTKLCANEDLGTESGIFQ